MIRTHVILLACIGALTIGCSKKNRVEKICDDGCASSAECDELGGQSEADCRAECEDALEDADKDCLDAFEDFSDCVSSNSCAAAGEECLGNAFSLLAACPELLEDSIGGDDCCGSTDTCDWANDGFCDCDGEQAWDVADCGS
jgi:hypothetical protein